MLYFTIVFAAVLIALSVWFIVRKRSSLNEAQEKDASTGNTEKEDVQYPSQSDNHELPASHAEEDKPEPEAGEDISFKPGNQSDEVQEVPVIEDEHKPVINQEEPHLLYKVGLMSDMHYDVGDTHCSEFGDDIRNALEFFRSEGVDFIASCGDFIQYSDDDFYGFYNLYRKHAGNIRLFTPMGNHDYLRIYDERQKTAPDYKDESQRQMMWQDTIADLHCRPEIEDRKSAEAESDIHFYEYGAEWDDPKHTGERTIKSKLSYWTERHGDIYVFLSLDYGKDTIPGTWGTLANAVSLLDDTDDVRRLREYVSDTGYDESRERKFDYMFYHPGVLLWLKVLIEDNIDKRIFVFTHHYLTHKTGGNSPLNGKWFYSQMRVWPYTEDERIRKRYYSGANSLCGVEFHFINKLNNLYRNVVWFSGHTHIRWSDEKYDPHLIFCDDDFAYVAPDGNEKVPLVDDIWQYANTSYDYRRYTRKSEDSIGKCGLNVHLPSLSKPIEIESGHGTTMYGASEGAVMEVWTDRIVISGYTFKDAGEKGYKNEKVVERSFEI